MAGCAVAQYTPLWCMTSLEEAVRRVLGQVPGSMRELAREAGIPHSTLVRIRQGHLGASPAVAEALADALGRWADECSSSEDLLRETLSQEVDENE